MVFDFYIDEREDCETVRIFKCYRKKDDISTFEFSISLRKHEELKNTHLVFFRLIKGGFRAYFFDVKNYMKLKDLEFINLKRRAKRG